MKQETYDRYEKNGALERKIQKRRRWLDRAGKKAVEFARKHGTKAANIPG